jgi:hypothetical protein
MRIAKVRKEMEASMQYQLKNAQTLEEKHEMIATNNPFLHAFGEKLTPIKPYESYADWVNRQYIGEPEHITSVEEAREYLKQLRTTEVEHGQA